MRHSIKRVGKRTLSIVLTLMMLVSTMIVGIVTTSAAIDNSGYIYFIKPDSWTASTVEFMVGHSSYSCGYDMTLVSNTKNLYVCQTSNWGDATEFAFFNTDGNWGGEKNEISKRTGFANNYTAVMSNYSLNNSNFYSATPASGDKGAALTMSHLGSSYDSSLNKTQTVGVKTSTDGSSYSTPSFSPAKVDISTYAFSNYNTCTTAKSGTINKDATTVSATASAGYLANTTLSVSNVDLNASFVGWYDSSGNKVSTSETFTYNPTGETSYYAYFNQTEKSYNITYAGDNCTKPANTTAKYNSSVSISGFTAIDGYVITGYTVTKTGDTSTSVEITDNSFTMPAYDVTVTATVKKQHTVTVTSGENGSVNPTTATVIDGETVTLTATPDKGYSVDTWTISSGASLSSGTLKDKVITVTVTADATINVSFIESQDIVIYLATPTGWNEWSTMSVTQSINGSSATGNKYIVSDSTSGTSIGCVGGSIGTKSINGTNRMVSYIVLPAECANWTSFYIGNASGAYFCSYQFSGAPQYGYCYYNTSTSDGDYCVATTISSPNANGSDTASCFVNETVNLTSTVTKANTSSGKFTAGGTTYHVKYIVTDESNNSNELDADVATWTPTTPGTYTITAKLYDDYTTFVSAETATVTVKTKTLSNITATASDATVKITDNSDTEITQAYEGDTVKVTVKAKTGYECSELTVTTESGTNVTVTKNDDGTYSFTMPGENVTVTPTITAKQAANVTVSSNDDTRGTATLTTTGTIYVGDSFTVKAAPKSDNVFKNFTVTGATQVGTVKNADGSTTGTFKATAQNVTVTANFEENSGVLQTDKYLIYQYSQNDANPALLNKYLPVYLLSDGTFVARFSEDEVKAMRGKDCHFALSKSSSYNESDIYWTNNNNVTVTKDPSDTTLIYANPKTYDNKFHLGQFYYDNDQVVGIEIEVGKDDGDGNVQYPNYVVRPIVEQLPEGTVTVYAKDGTSIEGGTHEMAETRVLEGYDKIISENEADRDCRYRAHKDSYLTIRTTMDATRYSNGYYVYAFCINGLNYPALEIKSGVYQTTYKVAGDEKNSIVEITPVYYNTKIEEAGDYLTIYVDASQLEGRWGNTLSCYSYYYKNAVSKEYFCTTPYPGQPMFLGANGLYYTRFPRFAYDSTGTKILNPDKNNEPYLISGLTVNSYSEKETHGQIYPDLNNKNLQTFDYDDFIYISNLGFDTLKFEIQCRYSVSNQHTLLNGATNAPVKNGTINLSDYESKGWENFYDFDGNKIDIIGNKLTPEQQTKDPIYIVSTGNQNTALGEWSTVWYVYNSKGEYITQGHPSDFISRNADETTSNPETTAYEAIKDQGYEGVPVKICYESNVGADGNTGTRIDGRWYYTKSNQEATVDVSVQYRDDISSNVWTNDTNETLTAVSGTATIDGVTSKTFEQRNVTAQLNAVPKNGYVFAEWGTVDDEGNYTKLSNIKTAASEFMVDTNYHLVARFEKVEEGSLILTHRKYVGPNAVGGNGYYLLSAVIKDSQDNELASFPITEGEIVIPDIQKYRGCKIEITMTTRMRGINTFVDWYMMSPEGDYDNITQSEDVWGKTGEVSQTIVQWVNNLYNNAELVLNTLHYYSDIAQVTRKAVLNYKYYNRFNEVRTYTKPVDLDDEYIDTNGYTITDKLIYDNAPAIEDLYKDCVWKITEQTTSKNGTTATIWGTHSESPCNVHLDDGINVTVDTQVKYNNYLKNDNNEFYKAPNADENGTPFAYWLVTKDGKEVARCYANDFNLKIVDHYTITAVYEETRESSLTISEPKYTREQFTDESGNVKSDYLYVDFIVAYMNSNGILLNGELATNYHTGLIVEFDRNIKVVDQNVDDAKLTKPLTEYKYEDYDHTKLQNIATDDTKESGSLTVDGTRALYKFEINNADYNNKNRIDYFVKFDNKNKSFRRYVMKAYYYVYYTDSNGKTVYQQTAPQYFCLFEIGNSTAETNNNNSSVTE